MSEIYIGRRFLKDSRYSQQMISVAAKKSLIPYKLTQKAPEKKNFRTATPNATSNQNCISKIACNLMC